MMFFNLIDSLDNVIFALALQLLTVKMVCFGLLHQILFKFIDSLLVYSILRASQHVFLKEIVHLFFKICILFFQLIYLYLVVSFHFGQSLSLLYEVISNGVELCFKFLDFYSSFLYFLSQCLFQIDF